MYRFKSIPKNTISFIKSTFSLKVIIQSVVIALIVMRITNYYNELNESKGNYNRLIKELEWNLSELRQYDAFLGELKNFLNHRKILSVENRIVFYPMFEAFPLRFQKRYYLEENSSEQNKYDLNKRYEPQTRNYIISELSKTGFLYNLKRKQDIKYLAKMSDPNWLKTIIEPINDIFSSINNLPNISGFRSEKATIERKTRFENECNKITNKINTLRVFLKSNIEQLEELISQVSELSS